MIKQTEWQKLSGEEQYDLMEETWSYRQCQKCLNYINLGGNNEENAEGMYLDDFTFDCLEEDVEKYEIKNNFSFADNVFCWKCIKKIKHDLGGV